MPRSFVHDVPWDPHLEFMFEGEELLLTARAFTHGYNIYGTLEANYKKRLAIIFAHNLRLTLSGSSENVVFHLYRSEIGPMNAREDKSWFYNHISGDSKPAVDRLFVRFFFLCHTKKSRQKIAQTLISIQNEPKH